MSNKGQALVIVISVLSLMFIIGVALFAYSQAERVASARHVENVRARYAAEAGVVYAGKVLACDKQATVLDTLGDLFVSQFAGGDVDLDGDSLAESRWIELPDSDGKPAGRFSVKINDESSKLNVNTCSPEALTALLSALSCDAAKVGSLLARRPVSALEQLSVVLTPEDFKRAKNYLTVYSQDTEIDLTGKRRTYLNTGSSQLLLGALQYAQVADPYKKSANIKDAADADLAQTRYDIYSTLNLRPTRLNDAGSWRLEGAVYAAPAGGAGGVFVWENLAVADGEYYCFCYAVNDTDIIGEINLQYVRSHDPLMHKVRVSGGALTLAIQPARDADCRLAYIVLVSPDSNEGFNRATITGTEAVVINEIFPGAAKDLSAGSVAIAPGDSYSHTFTSAGSGVFYARVSAAQPGGLVGRVSLNGQGGDELRDGEYLSAAVALSGDLTVNITNNSSQAASFGGIRLAQQPDVEYVELLNLSDSEQDLSNFTLEAFNSDGELIAGWPGRIPDGTRIQPYQHLIVTVDNTDAAPAPARLCGSGLSFQRVWGFSGVGMIFDEFADTIDKAFDLLADAGGSVVLKDGQARQVDAVEYESFQVAPFASLERADPGARFDSDGDGLFDGWYPCEALEKATPGQTNENKGMYTEESPLVKTKHDPAQMTVYNRPLAGLQELAMIPSGEPWALLAVEDISKMADHFSLQPLLVNQYLGGDFRVNGSFFESGHKGDSGVWESGAAPGSYYLSVISAGAAAQGQRAEIDYKTDAMNAFSPQSSLVFYDGAALYGFLELPAGTKSVQVRIRNEADVFISIAKIVLEPAMIVKGRINVNTAASEVLQSILTDELTAKILSSRPIGSRSPDKLGLGDLFLIDQDFMPQHDLLTVKSNIFEILCRGESSAAALAQQSIRTVVDRVE